MIVETSSNPIDLYMVNECDCHVEITGRFMTLLVPYLTIRLAHGGFI